MAVRKRKNSRRPRRASRANAASKAFSIIIRLLPFILAGAVIVMGVKATADLFLNSDYFRVKNIRISDEISDNRAELVRAILKSKKGLNILKVDLKLCESEIKYKHSEFKDIRVSRVLPDTLKVSYKIRMPFLQVESGYYYFVSDDAVILPESQPVADPQLPIITGIRVSNKLSSATTTKALKKAILLLREIGNSNFSKHYKVTKINIYDTQNPAIFIEDGTEIEIGEYTFKEKERLLTEVLKELESKNKKAKVIDLRFEDVVIIPR